MKILRMLRALPIIFVVIALASVAFMLAMYTELDNVQRNRAESKQLGIDLQGASDFLTNQAKSYSVTGEKAYFSAYEKEIRITKTREKAVEKLKQLGAPQTELDLLSEAKQLSDDLSVLEYQAFDLVEANDRAKAQEIIFGEDYFLYKSEISQKLEEFQAIMNSRCDRQYAAAGTGLVIAIATTILMVLVIILLVVWSFRLLGKKVKNIKEMSDIAERLSMGDFHVDTTRYISDDEFGLLAGSFMKMINSINNITNEIVSISNAAMEGDFKKRAQTAHFHGEFAGVLTRMNQMLEILVSEEEKVSNLKNQFLVNMSHEIRTPMNAVIGLSELALKKPQSEENYDTYKKINTSSKNLLTIINDILDFSKIAAEKLDIVEDDFFLEDIVSNAFMMAAERVENKPIEMLLSVSPEVPYALNGDKTRVWQVLKNVLDNSAKYTEQGKIILSISIQKYLQTEAGPKVLLRFEIQDTGLGMTPEQVENLFVPFQQFHAKGGPRNTGTGLGMSITKQLIELMGGQLHITSQVQVGTTTTIDLPFAVTDANQTLESILRESNIHASNVLLVDDDENALAIMSGLIHKLNVTPVCAKNSQEAFQSVYDMEAKGQHFDIILLDYHLGSENGLELGSKLKSRDAEQRLLMVSAYAKNLINVDIRQAGFTDIIEKPFIPTQFIKRLCDTISSAKPPSEQKYDQFPSASVLVCEDNEINQDVIRGVLNLFGIKPKIANNGKEAIEILEGGHFDLVLMDVIMPVMDGCEATAVIRSSKKLYRDIPILAMTANVMKEEIDKCFAAGMNGHIGKPLSIEETHKSIAKYLRYFESGQATGAKPAPKEPPQYPEHLPGMDLRSGIERFAGNKEAYFRSLVKFADGMQTYIKPYAYFQEEQTREESLRLLHTLKGVAANLSIQELAQTVANLELAHRNGAFTQDAYQTLLNLLEETKQTIETIQPAL